MEQRVAAVTCHCPALIVIGFGLTTLLPGRSVAQSVSPEPGVRMRVVTSAGAPVAGRLVSWRSDSLVLDVAGFERVFEPQSLVRAETYAGRKGQSWRGAKIGLLIGAVAGVTLGLADGDDPVGWFAMSAGEKALGGGLGLGALGMGIGAVAGAMSRVDRWHPVAIPGATRPAVAQSRARVGARIPF